MTQAQTQKPVGSELPTASTRLCIRLATPDDIPKLKRLVERSVLGLQVREYGGRTLDSALRHNLLALDPQLISDGTYYVAEVEGRIVGGGGWSRRRNIINDAEDLDEAEDLLDPATEAAKIRASTSTPTAPAWALAVGSCTLASKRRSGRDSGGWS